VRGYLPVGFTHGYPRRPASRDTEPSNLFESHWLNQWLTSVTVNLRGRQAQDPDRRALLLVSVKHRLFDADAVRNLKGVAQSFPLLETLRILLREEPQSLKGKTLRHREQISNGQRTICHFLFAICLLPCLARWLLVSVKRHLLDVDAVRSESPESALVVLVAV